MRSGVLVHARVVQEWQVCQVSVGVLGDVCRAIEEQVAPFVQPVMAVLLRNLESNDVQRTVQPSDY